MPGIQSVLLSGSATVRTNGGLAKERSKLGRPLRLRLGEAVFEAGRIESLVRVAVGD